MKPIMVLGLPRSGTRWVERLCRYSSCRSLDACFQGDQLQRTIAVQNGLIPIDTMCVWDGSEHPAIYIARCAKFTQQRLVFRLIRPTDPAANPSDIHDLAQICTVIICQRHPIACLASLQQCRRSGVTHWCHETPKGEQRRLMDYQKDEPTTKLDPQSPEIHVFKHVALQHRGHPVTWINMLYPELIDNEQGVATRLRLQLNLQGYYDKPLPKRVHLLPIQQRLRNWDELAGIAAQHTEDLRLEVV